MTPPDDDPRPRFKVWEGGKARSQPADDVPVWPQHYRLDLLAGQEAKPVEWRVQDLVPTGLGLLVGRPKRGKSWMALAMVIACADGTDFMGRVMTRRCKDVLYLALEDGEERIIRRVHKLGGRFPQNVIMVHDWTPGISLIEYLNTMLNQYPGIELVIVDAWAIVKPGQNPRRGVYDNDYSDLRPVHQLAKDRKITILLVHHTRKADASDVIDTINGSTAYAGCSDFFLILQRERSQNYGTLALDGRDVIGQDYGLLWDPATCQWTCQGPIEQVRQQQAESQQDQVLAFLRLQAHPLTAREISLELGLKYHSVRKFLTRLREHGVVFERKYRWSVHEQEG